MLISAGQSEVSHRLNSSIGFFLLFSSLSLYSWSNLEVCLPPRGLYPVPEGKNAKYGPSAVPMDLRRLAAQWQAGDCTPNPRQGPAIKVCQFCSCFHRKNALPRVYGCRRVGHLGPRPLESQGRAERMKRRPGQYTATGSDRNGILTNN